MLDRAVTDPKRTTNDATTSTTDAAIDATTDTGATTDATGGAIDATPDCMLADKRFERIASARPNATAVIDGNDVASYAELNDRANDMAARVRDAVEGNPRFIGIVLDHGTDMIAAILGVLKTGAAFVPAEPSFPIERIKAMFDACPVDAVLTQGEYASLFPGRTLVLVDENPPCQTARSANERTADDERAAASDHTASANRTAASDRTADDERTADVGSAAASERAAVSDRTPQDLAYVLFTSGTTGKPKGVCIEHRNLCSYMDSFHNEFHLEPNDRLLQCSACTFDIFIEEVFGALLAGATLVVAPPGMTNKPRDLARLIAQHGVSVVDGFPYLLGALNELPSRPRCVRLYISGGDVLHAFQASELVHEAMVYNTYGPSETTCCATYYRCDTGHPSADGTYPIGKPVLRDHVTLEGVDGKPVAIGQPGEVVISGGGVGRGYLQPCPEQRNFTVDSHGQRVYHSGDIAVLLPDGNLTFLHRKDSQVMIGGKRVEAKEVENVLLDDEEVQQAAVVPHEDEAGFSYLTAYIAPQHDQLDLTALKKRLSRKLAPFMIPEFFVRMDHIPLNTHGKPDTDALPVVLKAG